MDDSIEQASSGNIGRSKSAAMLGLALSFGASGVLFADSEATAAVGSFPITKAAASSESSQLPSVLGSQVERSGQVSSRRQAPSVYHTVEQGESLWQIAQEHQVEIRDIKVANRISPDATLQVGQVIKVPGEDSTQPTLVSLLPGVQSDSSAQGHAPSLERLMAGVSNLDTDAAEALQKSEVSDVQGKPVVIAGEELTGDISLRSAGLVSNSDGFQADLEQLASAEHLTHGFQTESQSAPAIPTSEDVTNAESPGYEVRPGDTIGDIAVSLGTTSEELTEANELEDPDFIVAGETLSVPEDVANELIISDAETSIAKSASELAAASSQYDFDGTRLSRLQSTVETRIHGSTTLQRLRGEQEVAVSESSTADQPQADVDLAEVEDPYTADLLAKVDSAQQVDGDLSTDGLTADITLEADGDLIALGQSDQGIGDIVVNPQFPGNSAAAQTESVETQRPELLAAAPLDPSVYVSSPMPAAGQVVSPEMPILPSADEYLPETPDYFNGYIWPTHGTLTSGYGWRWGRMHRGIDVAGPVGTPIVAAAPGVVEKAGWNSGGYGNMVEVRHADGSMTRYAHNSRISVRVGQKVAQGQHIADMGSTGYSTGPHLHFEIHIPNRGTVNPMAMLPGR
ncbi:MAG: peptidoglycan DD-metalloendopeptidase family protein [Cyanobacteria bacterium P01_H01_bin.26]